MAAGYTGDDGGGHIISGTITTDGSGDVSGLSAPGVASSTRTGTGLYKLNLDSYYRRLRTVLAVSSEGHIVNGDYTDDVANTSAPSVTLTTRTSAVADADRVITGGLVGAPTSASTQASGAAATVWRVDIDRCVAVTAGGSVDIAAEADHVIHDTTELVTDGQSCVAAVVADYNSGTPQFSSVKGTAATTGAEAAPTDAAITTALGHANWVRLADCTVNRTGDTTLTQSQDCSVRTDTTTTFSSAAANVVSGTISFLLVLQGVR